MTQTNKTARAAALRAVGIEGSMSRAPSLGADDPRHRIAADRELGFLQRFHPDDFELDGAGRVIAKGGTFVRSTDTPADYIGQANRFLSVDAAETKVTFVDLIGPMSLRVVIRTSVDITLTDDDDLVLVDSSGGIRTITLPAAAGRTGKTFDIKRLGTPSRVDITADGTDKIDGLATQSLTTALQSYTIVGNIVDGVGGGWNII